MTTNKTQQAGCIARAQMGVLTVPLVVMLAACTIADRHDTGDGDREGSAVADLSAEAVAFFALMRPDPFSDSASVPVLDEAASLPSVADAADQGAVEEAVAALAGDTLESLRFSPTTGRLLASSYERDIEAGPDLTDEDQLLYGVDLVLEGAGASSQQVHLELSTLRATGGEMGETPDAYEVAKTVQIGRQVLGVNVSLDYGAASFGMDGRFIGMWFQWRRVDYANSVLAVPGIETEEELMAAAAQSLADRGVVLRPSVYAIDVGTYYLAKPPADPESDLWTLHLVGYAGLRDSNGNGMGGEGEIPSYEFYLDGSGPLVPGVG